MTDNIKKLSANDSLRQAFYDHLMHAYNNFSIAINRIPYHPEIKKIIIQYIDTGFLWAQEGIKSADIKETEKPQDSIKDDTAA